MTRFRRYIVVAVAAVGLVASRPSGAEAAGSKDVPYTAAPLQLTGSVSQFPPGAQLFQLSGQGSDNTATFYGAWDDQHLYLGVKLTDSALFCSSLPGDSQVAWSNDSVELNFDLKNKKVLAPGDQDFRQFILPINYQNNPYDAYGSGETADVSFTSSVGVNVTLQGTLNDTNVDTGYEMMIQLPWTDLALTAANQVTFGFDGAVNDRDSLSGETTFMDWANLEVFAQPDKWGSLRLVGRPASPGGDGAPPPGGDGLVGSDWSPSPGGDGTAPPPSDRPDSDPMACDCQLARAPAGGLGALLPVLVGLLVLIACWRRRGF